MTLLEALKPVDNAEEVAAAIEALFDEYRGQPPAPPTPSLFTPIEDDLIKK